MSHEVLLACPGCGARNRVDGARLSDSPACGGCKRALIEPGRPLALDDTTFASVIGGSTLPVLVDFWAPWCGPCRMLAPVLEGFAREHGSSVLVAKVNVDEAPRTAAQYQVRSIPTLALFSQGSEHARHIGGMSLDQLRGFVRVGA